jgi:hypothetical protein
MDCSNTIASVDSLVRHVGLVDADGCARLLITQADAGEPLDCNSAAGLLGMLLASLDVNAGAIRCDVTSVLSAELCSTYAPRVSCAAPLTLEEALLECATIVDGTSAWVVSGAGTAAVNGTYCLDGEENGASVWTKVGGTRLLDSIMLNAPGGDWVITSSATPGYLYTYFNPSGSPAGPWNQNDGALPVPTSTPTTCGDGGAVVWRVAMITDASPDCASCNDMSTAEQRLRACIVTDGTDSYILAFYRGGSSVMSCENSGISGRDIVTASISPVGSCGIYAIATND